MKLAPHALGCLQRHRNDRKYSLVAVILFYFFFTVTEHIILYLKGSTLEFQKRKLFFGMFLFHFFFLHALFCQHVALDKFEACT